jgi:hypothetical protein
MRNGRVRTGKNHMREYIMKHIAISAMVIIAAAVCAVTLSADAAQEKASGAKISDIPGITTPDRTPHACVDCHVNVPERKVDYRLPSILAKWKNGADPDIFAKAKAAAPAGAVLTGKHPDVSWIKVIPDDCLKCHKRDSQQAPPFARLLHTIHLVGGKENHFLTKARGTCTSCHKLDQKTGAWHIGSGLAK